jgi:hypothetical protein
MAERKGFDTPSDFTDVSFGIEQTAAFDTSSDLDSFLSDADPTEVAPIESKEEKTEKSPTPTKTPTQSSTTPTDTEENEEVSIDSFLDDQSEENKEDAKSESSKKKEEKEENGAPQTESEPEEDDNIFQYYSDSLFNLGIFTKDEGEDNVVIETPEQFRERWELEGRKKAFSTLDNYIGRFGDKHKDFILSVLNGVDPEDYFSSYQNIQNLSELDISKEENQKIIFREAWKRQGLSAEKIEKRLQRAIELGELEDDVKDMHEVLLEQEQNRLEEIKAEKEREIQAQEHSKRVYANAIKNILATKLKDQEFDGIPVTEKVANEVYDYMVTEKYRLPSGELLTELDKFYLELKRPENYEARVKFALLAHSGLKLDNIKKSAVSKEVNTVFADIKRREKSKTPPPTTSKSTPKEPQRFNLEYSR